MGVLSLASLSRQQTRAPSLTAGLLIGPQLQETHRALSSGSLRWLSQRDNFDDRRAHEDTCFNQATDLIL
jgi:hypothetical protein